MDYDRLPTERRPAEAALDTLTPRELVALFAEHDRRAIAAVADAGDAIADAMSLAVNALRSEGRLIYLGAGTSGRLGVLDAAEIPPTFGVHSHRVVGVIAGGERALRESAEGMEDSAEAGVVALQDLGLKGDDFVVGISASGTAQFVLGALDYARSQKSPRALITCAPTAAHRSLVDVLIAFDPGPEPIAGSTRMGAGIATKAILHALSTGTMVQLGKVHGDLMVDVRASNRKLRRRALRIVMELTGLPEDAAVDRLSEAENSPKLAVIMEMRGLDLRRAKEALDRAGDSLRRALK